MASLGGSMFVLTFLFVFVGLMSSSSEAAIKKYHFDNSHTKLVYEIINIDHILFKELLMSIFVCNRNLHFHDVYRIMASPPALPPPPPPSDASASPCVVKRTCKDSRLRSLSTRPPGADRPVVHIDPTTGKADGPHRKKLITYLGIVARDKVDVMYENWKEVPTAQKDLIWEDIQAEFEIPEASDSRTKKKLLQTVGEKYGISKEKWAQFCQTRRDPSWEDVRKKAQAIQKQNTAPHVLSRGGYEYLEQKLLAEKTKKKLEETVQSGSVDGVIDPPSSFRHHVKWKMARTKKTEEMTTDVAKEIVEKIGRIKRILRLCHFEFFDKGEGRHKRIQAVSPLFFWKREKRDTKRIQADSFEEKATQGSFVPHGRQDVLTAVIGCPEHPGHVRAAGASVTIKQYFGSAPRMSRSSSSLPPEELQDQLEESITEKVTRQLMASFSQMQSQIQSQMQSQGLALPTEPLVGPSGPRVNTKRSCVDPLGNDPKTSDSDRCGLYIKADPARLVALGRVYKGSTAVHNTPLLPGQVKVGMEKVTDADAPVPIPTDEVSLVGQAFHTFLARPTHLVKSLSQQAVVSPAKPPQKPDLEVDDPHYLMTLTIPELFLRPYQVTCDAIVFGVFNSDFPLYIKHEDLFEIAHGGQCLSISMLQLWILMRAGNSDIYGFLVPQSIQRSASSKWDVYLGAYLNGGHWQVVVIVPKEHLVVWFCSLHNRPANYLKGIINSALKGLDDAPQPKSKAPAWWIVVKYFNDPRPLEPERLKALQMQWAQYYLRVRDQTPRI
ncbi:hypothetical protein GmHk_17G049227 [Glycine max]|nr:hypothetical protein GmHk_17G049227 [Glycine max]